MSLDARIIRPIAEKAAEAAWDVLTAGLWKERLDEDYTVTIKLKHRRGGLLDTTIDINTRERERT